jgi:hypothetical protein
LAEKNDLHTSLENTKQIPGVIDPATKMVVQGIDKVQKSDNFKEIEA